MRAGSSPPRPRSVHEFAFFFFQAEDGIRDHCVTGVQTCALPIYFGPVAQQLVQGATNWTVAPAPNPAWAHAAYAERPSGERLAALWEDVFTAMRVNEPSPLAAWQLQDRKSVV